MPDLDHHSHQNLQHQPSCPLDFVNELMPNPMPPSHRQTNKVNLLHPCMPASLLWCITPPKRSGSLPLWYMSCWKMATKCTPVMAWSTTAWDDTFVNAVSSPLTLPQLSQQPHQRLLPDLTLLHHCLHPSGLHNCCSLHQLNPQCLQLQNHRHQLSQSCPCACAYICNTQHSPCGVLQIGPCPQHTQVPDPGNITALWPTRGEPWPGMSLECLTIS